MHVRKPLFCPHSCTSVRLQSAERKRSCLTSEFFNQRGRQCNPGAARRTGGWCSLREQHRKWPIPSWAGSAPATRAPKSAFCSVRAMRPSPSPNETRSLMTFRNLPRRAFGRRAMPTTFDRDAGSKARTLLTSALLVSRHWFQRQVGGKQTYSRSRNDGRLAADIRRNNQKKVIIDGQEKDRDRLSGRRHARRIHLGRADDDLEDKEALGCAFRRGTRSISSP